MRDLKEVILKVLPPIWLFFFLGIALIAHFLFPATRVFELPDGVYRGVLFALLLIAGSFLTLRASNIFAIEKTEILPTSPANRVLVTRGPYRISRNPMYLGMVLILLGTAVYFGTLPVFLAAIAQFLVLNFVFIPFEEEKMARQFGEQYAAYKRAVRRWL